MRGIDIARLISIKMIGKNAIALLFWMQIFLVKQDRR